MQCIVCKTPCDILHAEHSLHPNIAGTMFEATGNYGSTVWDPLDPGRFLQIVICDECLLERKDQVDVVQWRECRRELIKRSSLAEVRKEEGHE